MLLAGDVGGTKTHLALFEKDSGRKIAVQEVYPSKNYASLQELIREFLQKNKASVTCGCLGIAGPVENNRCKATNLPWVVDGKELANELGISKVVLINDLQANAFGLEYLNPDEFETLHPGEKNAVGNRALISAGTGLGEGGMYWDGKDHHPFACEGGHVDFGPRDEKEIQLFLFLKKKFPHVSYERIVSGMGLALLYEFLFTNDYGTPTFAVANEMTTMDPAKVITMHALDGSCELCQQTVLWFVSLYGSEAGNLALKIFATGGLYVGGGIAPKILPFLKKEIFLESFFSKGRMRAVLEKMPIKVVLNANTALYGAMLYARKIS